MTALIEARQRVGAWVERIKSANADKRQADATVDLTSLERAADLETIYADMSWVADMPEVKRKGRGRRVDPKSREQFAKWVHMTYGWGTSGRLAHLHQAHELRPILLTAVREIHPTGEGVLRPLSRLRAAGYGDAQAQVWAAAVERAGGECPTASQVSAEVTAYLDKFKLAKNAAADPRTAEEKRGARKARLLAEFDAILAEDNSLADATVKEMIQHFNNAQRTRRRSA